MSSKEINIIKSFVSNLKSDDNDDPQVFYDEKKYQEFRKILWRNPHKDFYICYSEEEICAECHSENNSIDDMYVGCFELYTQHEFKKLWPKIDELLKIKNNKIQLHPIFRRDSNYYNNSSFRDEQRIIRGIGNFLDENPNLIHINHDTLARYINF